MLHSNAIISNKKSLLKKKIFIYLVKMFEKRIIFIALSEKEREFIYKIHPKNKVIVIENLVN